MHDFFLRPSVMITNYTTTEPQEDVQASNWRAEGEAGRSLNPNIMIKHTNRIQHPQWKMLGQK